MEDRNKRLEGIPGSPRATIFDSLASNTQITQNDSQSDLSINVAAQTSNHPYKNFNQMGFFTESIKDSINESDASRSPTKPIKKRSSESVIRSINMLSKDTDDYPLIEIFQLTFAFSQKFQRFIAKHLAVPFQIIKNFEGHPERPPNTQFQCNPSGIRKGANPFPELLSSQLSCEIESNTNIFVSKSHNITQKLRSMKFVDEMKPVRPIRAYPFERKRHLMIRTNVVEMLEVVLKQYQFDSVSSPNLTPLTPLRRDDLATDDPEGSKQYPEIYRQQGDEILTSSQQLRQNITSSFKSKDSQIISPVLRKTNHDGLMKSRIYFQGYPVQIDESSVQPLFSGRKDQSSQAERVSIEQTLIRLLEEESAQKMKQDKEQQQSEVQLRITARDKEGKSQIMERHINPNNGRESERDEISRLRIMSIDSQDLMTKQSQVFSVGGKNQAFSVTSKKSLPDTNEMQTNHSSKLKDRFQQVQQRDKMNINMLRSDKIFGGLNQKEESMFETVKITECRKAKGDQSKIEISISSELQETLNIKKNKEIEVRRITKVEPALEKREQIGKNQQLKKVVNDRPKRNQPPSKMFAQLRQQQVVMGNSRSEKILVGQPHGPIKTNTLKIIDFSHEQMPEDKGNKLPNQYFMESLPQPINRMHEDAYLSVRHSGQEIRHQAQEVRHLVHEIRHQTQEVRHHGEAQRQFVFNQSYNEYFPVVNAEMQRQNHQPLSPQNAVRKVNEYYQQKAAVIISNPQSPINQELLGQKSNLRSNSARRHEFPIRPSLLKAKSIVTCQSNQETASNFRELSLKREREFVSLKPLQKNQYCQYSDIKFQRFSARILPENNSRADQELFAQNQTRSLLRPAHEKTERIKIKICGKK